MNSITLTDKDSSVYTVEHNGKTFQCRRVTGLIEETRKTPVQLVRWFVNMGAEAVANHPDLHLLDADQIKKVAWEAKEIIGNKAMEDGSAVHKCIETGTGSDDPTISQCLKAYDLFKKNHEPESLIHELRVYDTPNLVAGSIDFIGHLNKDYKTIWILDWKTSSQINDNYLLQVAIYQQILTNFIKEFKKNPTGYAPDIQAQMKPLVSALKRGVSLRCGVVRLDKHIPVRETTQPKYEFVALDKRQVSDYQKEFKLVLKLTKLREGIWERSKARRDTARLSKIAEKNAKAESTQTKTTLS